MQDDTGGVDHSAERGSRKGVDVLPHAAGRAGRIYFLAGEKIRAHFLENAARFRYKERPRSVEFSKALHDLIDRRQLAKTVLAERTNDLTAGLKKSV